MFLHFLFILQLLPWITLTASEKLFQATSEALVLLAVICASLLPQTVEFFCRKLSDQLIGDLAESDCNLIALVDSKSDGAL